MRETHSHSHNSFRDASPTSSRQIHIIKTSIKTIGLLFSQVPDLTKDTPFCNVWLTMLHGIGLDPNKPVRHGDSSGVLNELII